MPRLPVDYRWRESKGFIAVMKWALNVYAIHSEVSSEADIKALIEDDCIYGRTRLGSTYYIKEHHRSA